MTVPSSLPCKGCNGSGIRIRQAFTSVDGVHYPEQRNACISCDGKGSFLPIDFDSIVTSVINFNRKARTLFSKRPKDSRAYYVWRMARFHGGADVTMPMTASLEVRNDPYREELDIIADKVAWSVFGTNMAGAHRWGRALGRLDRDIPGLPNSAYNSGPVADQDKPEEEELELR